MIEVDGQLIPNYDATMVSFSEGDVVTGKVVRIDKDEVLVDIGYKSEGVIPQNELSIRRSIDPAEEVSLGEEVDALVLTKEDQDGRLVLSKKRARFERAWRRIEAAAESGEPVEGTVIEVVKGGLIIDLGVRGFLPASLVDIRRVQNLDEYMGQKIECKVIELNRSRNNVVLSRRAVLEEERKEARQQILDRLQRGEVVTGTISNIVDFGAFVDLDGIDGLIHISELSWGHVNHPSEVLSIGDEVSVKVLDIDRDRQRISLGLKQTQEDPWERVVRTYNVGDVLEGKVTKVVSFGAFVEIMEGVEGLVHISELAQHHVENPREVVEPERRREGQDPRDRRGAPPPVAEPEARRGAGAAAARADAGRARGRAGDGRSGRARPGPVRRGLHARGAAEAARGEPRRPRRPRPPAETAEAPAVAEELCRGGRGACCRGPEEPAAEAEEPAAEEEQPAPAAEVEETEPPADDRPDASALRRLDRGHRLRQVGGAGRIRAPGGADPLHRRRRARAARCRGGPRLLARAVGRPRAGGRRGRPRRRRHDRVRAPGGAVLAGGELFPRVGQRMAAWRAELERRRGASPSWRCRCCSRPASRARSTRPSPW